MNYAELLMQGRSPIEVGAGRYSSLLRPAADSGPVSMDQTQASLEGNYPGVNWDQERLFTMNTLVNGILTQRI